MKINWSIVKKSTYRYIYLLFSLLTVFVLLSLFELYQTFENYSSLTVVANLLLNKIINDFWTIVFIGLIFAPFFYFFRFLNANLGTFFVKFLFVLLILIQFALIKYSLTTFVNLGADLLGYSIEDISLTVSTTESWSLLSVLPFLVFPILFLLINYWLVKRANGRKAMLILGIFVFVFGGLKLIFYDAVHESYKNKLQYLTSDVIRFKKEKRTLQSSIKNQLNDFPLLRPTEKAQDVLSPFFKVSEEKPNIVFISMEGLGGEFVGQGEYRGFTPFIDSLLPKSLYWKNFLSTTGRTFGVIPSVIGSLPFGEQGFLAIPKTPSHISLLNILKANGYTTSFYAGHNSAFDRLANFLEYNEIDNIIDMSTYGPEFQLQKGNNQEFSWGYPDAYIMKKVLATIDDFKEPRFDIIMTLTNHDPFEFPEKDQYIDKVRQMVNSGMDLGVEKKKILDYAHIFATLLYSDSAIQNYFEHYKERDDFENTIFIITGDHRLIPIPHKDQLCRYHVPLIIYSPLLKKAEQFNAVSSHFDIAPSLLTFLNKNYTINQLDYTAWLGKGLDTMRSFRNTHQIPLMRYKGKLDDFIYENYFYSDGKLYEIKDDLGTYKITSQLLERKIKDSLLAFKKLNLYVTKNDKIYPDSLNFYAKPQKEFTQEELTIIENYNTGKNFDELFTIARDLAFNKEYNTSRLLCDYILNEIPNHHDARTLKGRTLAWEGKYSEAEFELMTVIRRGPYYPDAYLALLDVYWWSDQEEKSGTVFKTAVKYKLDIPELNSKMIQAYQRLGDTTNAKILVDSILEIHPDNIEYNIIKQNLKQ